MPLGLAIGAYKKRNETKTLIESCTNLTYSWTGFLHPKAISESWILMLLSLVIECIQEAYLYETSFEL